MGAVSGRVLIAARILQGIGGALLFVVGLVSWFTIRDHVLEASPTLDAGESGEG